MPDFDDELEVTPSAEPAATLETVDVPAQGNEEEQEEQEEQEPAPSQLNEDLLDDNGKLLGKFDDVPTLARSYKELEKEFGKKSGRAAEYRREMEAAGFTFDDAGKPLPPAKPAPAAEPAAPAPAVQGNDLPPGHTMVDGVEHDYLGLPIIPQSDWDALQEEDPDQYQLLRNQFETRRVIREEQFQQTQRGQQTQRMEQARTTARQTAKDTWGFGDAEVTEIEQEVATLLEKAPPAARSNPDSYMLLLKAVAADRIPAMKAAHAEEIRQILAGNQEAITRGRKVIAVEKGTVRPADTSRSSTTSLTADEKKMAKVFNMTEEEYARNK